jgi:hypothetical protein
MRQITDHRKRITTLLMDHNAIHFKRSIMPAEISPATGNVTTQEVAIPTKSFQRIPSPDLMVPTATTEPTWTTEPIFYPLLLTRQWVVLIGKPALLASSAVIAAPNSMVNPLKRIIFCLKTAGLPSRVDVAHVGSDCSNNPVSKNPQSDANGKDTVKEHIDWDVSFLICWFFPVCRDQCS